MGAGIDDVGVGDGKSAFKIADMSGTATLWP